MCAHVYLLIWFVVHANIQDIAHFSSFDANKFVPAYSYEEFRFKRIWHFSSLDDMPINAKCQHCIYDDPFWTQELVEGFDQETAAVVLARYISLKMEMEVIFLCHHDSSYNCSCHLGWLYWLQSLWWHWFSIQPQHIMLSKKHCC